MEGGLGEFWGNILIVRAESRESRDRMIGEGIKREEMGAVKR